MNTDPRAILATSRMTHAQILVVLVTVGLIAVDGFDVLSISFASPVIAQEWGIDRAALGFVLSMELIGMAVGSILLGGVADWIGRRSTLLACLLVTTVGMALVTTAANVYQLSAWRVLTGLGIGGMLATTNAVVAEFSSLKRRELSISMMAAGYPIGAVFGGIAAAFLLSHSNWRAVFGFGAAITAVFIPIIVWKVPESVAWLCERQPARALERVNRSLLKLGYDPITSLPIPAAANRKSAIAELFRPGLALSTVLVTAIYFLQATTLYFILKWVPKIVVDMGFVPSSAAGVLVWANVGGAVGGVVLGLLTQRFALRRLIFWFLVASAAMVAAFGHGQATLTTLSLICMLTGFFTIGSVVGVYSLLANTFPAALRARGSGFAIGISRCGAALAPIIAGLLFRAGFSLQYVALLMGSGSLIAAACLLVLPARCSED